MASFKDKFLQDLEDLSADEEEKVSQKEDEEEKSEQENNEEDEDADFVEYKEREERYEKLMAKGYQSKVRGNAQFRDHIEALERELEGESGTPGRFKNLTPKERAQQLIIQTNDYLKHIDNDILIVHKQLRDAYAVKFSELESIILNSVDYAKAVKVIGNTVGDLSQALDLLKSWLSNQTLMSVTVSFSASGGRSLTEKEHQEVNKLCEEVISLDHDKHKML